MSELIRAVVAEDEPLARRTLRDFIGDVEWMELVAEAENGVEAISKIEELRPDLVFLDVQMPEISGIQVLESIKHKPSVVFTTAFDHYAVTAFEFEAIDYLRKPFGRERFQKTVQRVREKLNAKREENASKDQPETDTDPPKKLFVRKGDMILPLEIQSISWLEANGDYVNIHALDGTYMASGSLTEFVNRLDRSEFVQVHRSSVVNLSHVTQMEEIGRSLLIYLKDGSEVTASRSGSQELKKLFA